MWTQQDARKWTEEYYTRASVYVFSLCECVNIYMRLCHTSVLNTIKCCHPRSTPLLLKCVWFIIFGW